jgi:hypothetical protein
MQYDVTEGGNDAILMVVLMGDIDEQVVVTVTTVDGSAGENRASHFHVPILSVVVITVQLLVVTTRPPPWI